MAQAGVAYCVLAGLGVSVLFEFVPGIFDFGELSVLRLLVLLALLIFVVAPLVAIGYIVLGVLIEGLVMGVGWVFQACFRALARFFKRLYHGAGE